MVVQTTKKCVKEFKLILTPQPPLLLLHRPFRNLWRQMIDLDWILDILFVASFDIRFPEMFYRNLTLALASRTASASAAIALCICTGKLTSLLKQKCHFVCLNTNLSSSFSCSFCFCSHSSLELLG